MSNLIEEKLTRKEFFTKIINDWNELTGFSATLDDLNPDERYEYAHGTHIDKNYKITFQMDNTTNKMAYAHTVYINGLKNPFNIENTLTRKELNKIMRSEAFKIRIGTLEMLDDLISRAYQEVSILSKSLMTDSIKEIEKQDAYDTVMLVARKLLRD